jgi:hypothetical protein
MQLDLAIQIINYNTKEYLVKWIETVFMILKIQI